MIFTFPPSGRRRPRPLRHVPFHLAGVREREIEDLLVAQPALLFDSPNNVLVVARQRAGGRSPDILALDGERTLYVIEIKRGGIGRSALGQVQEYAAEVATWGLDRFEREWRALRADAPRLPDAFRQHFGVGLDEPVARRRELVLVAPKLEPGLRPVLESLRSGGLGVTFAELSLWSDGKRIFAQAASLPARPAPSTAVQDWCFNTNEKNHPGAYAKMLSSGVVALRGFGPKRGAAMLNKPAAYDRVFAYVSGSGFIAVGRFAEGKAFPSTRVFGAQHWAETHREVHWLAQVPVRDAIPIRELRARGLRFPAHTQTIIRVKEPLVARFLDSRLHGIQAGA
jgi:hypothetical protein